jgi:hypothetical protein
LANCRRFHRLLNGFSGQTVFNQIPAVAGDFQGFNIGWKKKKRAEAISSGWCRIY